MKWAAGILTALLAFAILALWVEERWAWSLFQVGLFVLAGWRVMQARPLEIRREAGVLAVAAIFPLVQLAANATVSRGATWNAALDWLTYWIVFVVTCDLLAAKRVREWFLRAVPIFGMVLAAVAVLQKYTSHGRVFWLFPSRFSEDVLGPFVSRNQYAAWIELLLPVALYVAAMDRKYRALYAAAAAVMFGSVIASASRAGSVLVVGEVVMVAAILLMRRRCEWRVLLVGTLQFALLAGTAVAAAGWHELQVRMEAGLADRVRVDAARASLQMVRARPWLGSGLGTWATVYPSYASFDTGLVVNQAHNDWAQWAAEGGLPFVLTLGFFAALLCKSGVQSIYGLGTAAFLLHAFVDYPMQQRPALAAWFFAIAGAAISWRNSRSSHL